MRNGQAILLDSVLTPNPPMSRRALLIILIFVCAINLAFAVSFMLRGAWPIAPFLGLDVALLAWAFRTSRREARRFEHVTLTASQLHIHRQPARGAGEDIELNPYWVRVEMDDPPEPWSQLALRSHGRKWLIGSFLSPDARAEFAEALRNALRRARENIPG
ncbi:MAG TPA: DUF2244 domain-containing protein [Rhizomicrobium sp.]|nr:DUF2244 domain-containing protein [Rhizomicrobium sp.]